MSQKRKSIRTYEIYIPHICNKVLVVPYASEIRERRIKKELFTSKLYFAFYAPICTCGLYL